MIQLAEALNFRCLRYVSRPLKPFHVLVGPNASGKTTFLDVIGFLSDVISNGLDHALEDRATNPQDLLYQHRGSRMELAVEAMVPEHLLQTSKKNGLSTIRYQVAIGFEESLGAFEFKAETLTLKRPTPQQSNQRTLFPDCVKAPRSLQHSVNASTNRTLINKVPGGNDNFYSEKKTTGRGWAPSFRLGPQKSALGNLPADETSFPIASWFREFLRTGVQRLLLNSRAIMNPSPPTRVAGFLPDGSNLSWVVARLKKNDPERHTAWIRHLRTALPDLIDIGTVERPEDRHCYLIYEYDGGLRVPSWLVSDGTIRLTALTLPAYLADLRGVYLVEEPENGIHPGAVETVYDSLNSMYAAQVLLATHSPVVLSAASPDDVLCFAKDDEGGTDIVLGSEHPGLQKWRGDMDLGTLLASGVLG